MRTRKVGSLAVTEVGVGCSNFGRGIDEATTAEIVNAALDAGINFFDTADSYGGGRSEIFLGKALATRRDEAVIATKIGQCVGGGRPEYLKTAAESCLRQLGVEQIDLLQFHWPDPDVPVTESLDALSELVQEGKAIEIGCSNFGVEKLQQVEEHARATGSAQFVSTTNQYSLLLRGRELDVIPECERSGIAFFPYFPLHNGLLTGKYRRNEEPPVGSRLAVMPERRDAALTADNFDVIERLAAYAEERGHTILELAYARMLAHPSFASIISGASSAAQVRSNAVSASWELTDHEIAEIDVLAPTLPAPLPEVFA